MRDAPGGSLRQWRSLVAHVAWGPSPLGRHFDDGYWASTVPGRPVGAMREATELVPADAGVAATAAMVPHLTHRRRVFEWPQPFLVVDDFWGVEGSKPPDPEGVDYLVLNVGDDSPFDVHPDSFDLYVGLVSPPGPFEIVFERDGIVVARRSQDRNGRDSTTSWR